jgi:hypothetical protein
MLYLRRLGGASALLRAGVRSVRRAETAAPIETSSKPTVVVLLSNWSPADLALRARNAVKVILRLDRVNFSGAIGVPVFCVPVAMDVSLSLWTLSDELRDMAFALAAHCANVANLAAFGVGRNGRIAASYCARFHAARIGADAASPAPAGGVAVVFVARDLDLVPLAGVAGDSLLDALLASPATVRVSRVRIDEDDAEDNRDQCFADDVLCATSLPFRTALVAGTQQAAFECVQRALLDAVPPEHMPTVSGALTLTKAKKAAQLLRQTTNHVLRLELALVLLALAPATKRIVRRRESALRVAMALAVTDTFAVGVSHLQAQASERATDAADGDGWTDDELRALVRAFASAVGQAPTREVIASMFPAANDVDQFHSELERIATARATQMRRLGSILFQPGDANNEYVPFVRRLARQLFVERQVDEEQDCVHVSANDEVLGADYSAMPAPSTKHKPAAAAKALGLLGSTHKTRVSDFSTVYFVICGAASATEVREIHDQVRASPLAKSLNVTVVSAMPSLAQ